MNLENCACVRRMPVKRVLRKAGVILAAVLVLAALAIYVLSLNMRPAMQALASARINAMTARAMNDAISECMVDDDDFTKLIDVLENGQKVYMLKADTRRMNMLASECALAAQKKISDIGEQGISVPIGTITGIPFFAGKGMRIRVLFTPAGSVQSELHSEFTSTGINQSLYRVNLMLTARVRLVMPGVSDTITVATEASIAESVIVGEVPQVYTNVADTEDMLNLVPTEVP